MVFGAIATQKTNAIKFFENISCVLIKNTFSSFYHLQLHLLCVWKTESAAHN